MSDFSLVGGIGIMGFLSPMNTNDTYAVIDPLYGVDGAMCPSLKLFWYNVIVKDNVHNKPHKRFMDTFPFSSENKPFTALKNSFIVLVIYLTINITKVTYLFVFLSLKEHNLIFHRLSLSLHF